MPRRSVARKSKLERLRALPWLGLMRAGIVIGSRWRSLSTRDRARLAQLARRTQGRPGTLSAKERGELRRLVGKLDLAGIGRELLPLVRRGRGRGRRGRRRACK